MKKFREAFSRTAGKKKKSKLDFLTAAFKEQPRLKREQITFPSQGNLGHVAFTGDYAVKAPQKLQEAENFIREEEITAYMGARIPLTPKVTYVGKQHHFYIMEKMSGISFYNYPERNGFRPGDTVSIGKSLANFAAEFNKLFPKSKKKDLPKYNYTVTKLPHKMRSKSFRRYIGDKRFHLYKKFVKHYHDRYEDIVKNAKPFVMHTDMHPGNILIDKENPGKVTAVVDYGFVNEVLFPENFLHLNEELVEVFYKSLRETQGAPVDEEAFIVQRVFLKLDNLAWLTTEKYGNKRYKRYAADLMDDIDKLIARSPLVKQAPKPKAGPNSQ